MYAFLEMSNETGESRGWTFKKEDGSRMKQVDLQEDFYALMDEVQDTTKLIDNRIDIWEEYGL